LKLDLPEPEIQGVFETGQEYELYRAVKTILSSAATERLDFSRAYKFDSVSGA